MSPLAVVIGAGVNELVAAHLLARAGRRVLVLGPRAAQHDAPDETGWIPPRVVHDLELRRHGLALRHPDPWAAAALPEGGRLELWHDMARSVEAIRRLSPADAAKWPAFCERMAHLAHFLAALYEAPPPDPLSRNAGDLVQLAAIWLRSRRLGRQGIEDLLRLLPMPVADLLDDWFECDALKGVLAAAGIRHLNRGPRSGGTVFNLVHQHVGSPAGVFRPPRSNIGRTLASIPGFELRRGAEVARIRVRAGRIAGVALADGEEIAAPLVLCGLDPRRTLLELVEPGWLDPELVRAVRNIRRRGVVARVRLVLERAPGFSTLVVAPSLDYLERAYDEAKHGRISQVPYLEARCDNRHAEVHVQYAPYALADGAWDESRRAALGDTAARLLAPQLGATAPAPSVLSPRDLQERCGWPEGQARHAELALDQLLWMRPVPALARYATPLAGLVLCGPAMHPGGGVAGAAGANAARVVLRQMKQLRDG